jgi:hypothetical protein
MDNKKVIILAVIAALGGIGLGILRSPERKGQKAQDLFPPEKLAGQVANTNIKVIESGKNGRPVLAIAVSQFGIKPEQVSPTGYGALHALHRQYPKTDWVSVFIAEDSAMADASNWVGVAELRLGKITITGGIPTQADFDSLRRIGQPLKRPTQEDLLAVAAVYDSTEALSSERWDLSQTLLGAGSGRIDDSRFLFLDLETTALHAAAKAVAKEPKDLEKTLADVTRFYWMKAGIPQ